MTIDKLTLDAMVQGHEVDQTYWKQLLREPEADKLWFEAVERRKQIDRHTQLIALSPQTALLLRNAKRCINKMTSGLNSIVMDLTHPPETPRDPPHSVAVIGCVFPIWDAFLGSAGNPFVKSSANDHQSSKVVSVDIAWNTETIEEIPNGSHLTFKSDELACWHYQYMDESGWLEPEDSWKVDPDDGPVVLSFFSKKLDEPSWEHAMQSDCDKAILTIIPVLE